MRRRGTVMLVAGVLAVGAAVLVHSGPSWVARWRFLPQVPRAAVVLWQAGASAALVFMPVSVIVLGGVDRTLAGTVSGLLQTAQQLGGAVGLAVIVSVYASGSVPGEFVPGTATAFHTSALFVGIALLIGLVVLRPRRTPGLPVPASEREDDVVPEAAPALATRPA